MSINPENLCITRDTSILDAMKVIDRGSVQIALVVDEHGHLLGTLTDGDIRRALMDGKKLETPCGMVMNEDYRFIRSGSNKTAAVEMMRREVLIHMPVLDDDGRVQKLLLLQDLLTPPILSNAVVIMAGGKGTRLRPHTEYCPKPMLQVDNQPMLEILIEQCIASGFHQFYLSVNYLKEQIIDYFEDGSSWGVEIKYLIEKEPLGTAGSLQLLGDSLTEPFLVLNGDVLTRVRLSNVMAFHHEHRAAATMCTREHTLTLPFGVVQTDGAELAGFKEKPTYRHQVNAGMYVIHPSLLPLLPVHVSMDMPDFLLLAQQNGHRVAVCPIHEYWLDVGRPETLEEAHATWRHSK